MYVYIVTYVMINVVNEICCFVTYYSNVEVLIYMLEIGFELFDHLHCTWIKYMYNT